MCSDVRTLMGAIDENPQTWDKNIVPCCYVPMTQQDSFELCVSIVRWGLDDQPGWVECVLVDAQGRPWFFFEKAPVVSCEDLRPDTMYPRPGRIACHIIERRMDASEKEVLVVDTASPWGIEATSGETRFEVRPEQVVKVPPR